MTNKNSGLMDPELTSNARDGFTLDVNETQLFFKRRENFPMFIEIYVEDEEQPLGSINTKTGKTVTLGGINERLAHRVDEIREMPVDQIPEALDELAYRLNPAGRQRNG